MDKRVRDAEQAIWDVEQKPAQVGVDRIRLETESGLAVEGCAYLTECINSEVAGIAGCFGRKSPELALSYQQGVHFNTLLPHSLDRIDALSAALDACVRVKVSRL